MALASSIDSMHAVRLPHAKANSTVSAGFRPIPPNIALPPINCWFPAPLNRDTVREGKRIRFAIPNQRRTGNGGGNPRWRTNMFENR